MSSGKPKGERPLGPGKARGAENPSLRDLEVRGQGVQGGASLGDDNGAGDLTKGIASDSAELKKGTR
jgi:hypothetical protein